MALNLRQTALIQQYLVPIVGTLLVHLLIVGVFFVGWDTSSEKSFKPAPNYVEAKLVKLKAQATKQTPQKKKPKKIDLVAKKQEQARLKREAEKQRQQKVAAQKKADAAKKKKAEAERKAQEQRLADERKKAEQQRQLLLEAEFADALASEELVLAEEESAIQAASYQTLIQQQIENNWSRPPSARKGMRCELLIDLVPTGKVVNVVVAKSSGNAAFDRSAEQAVKKVDQFNGISEMPSEVFEKYFRRVRLGFSPKDLRL